MRCPRCQHENRPQAKFCEECGSPFKGASPTAPSDADPTSEVERLKRALTESLEQQTAMAEILKVISDSPTDAGPVFATILDKAMALRGAQLGTLWRYEGDETFRAVVAPWCRPRAQDHVGKDLSGTAGRSFGRAARGSRFRSSTCGRPSAYRRREPVWVNNVEQEGMRTLLNVPLVSDVRYLGAISLYRREVRAFTEKEIALLQTFADQAVIAIENVRLFNETKEALEQQTATSEILRVIASSPTDTQPVFDAIAQRAVRVCDGMHCVVHRFDGDLDSPGGASRHVRRGAGGVSLCISSPANRGHADRPGDPRGDGYPQPGSFERPRRTRSTVCTSGPLSFWDCGPDAT